MVEGLVSGEKFNSLEGGKMSGLDWKWFVCIYLIMCLCVLFVLIYWKNKVGLLS